jgi:hypothetical protein
MLKQLVYISSATVPFKGGVLEDVLRKARDNNRAMNVSGILLYSDQSIMQVLEGPPDAVDRVFGGISRDPRHTAVRVVQDAFVETRDFGDWAMACSDATADDFKGVLGLEHLTEEAAIEIANQLSQPVARIFARQFVSRGRRRG